MMPRKLMPRSSERAISSGRRRCPIIILSRLDGTQDRHSATAPLKSSRRWLVLEKDSLDLIYSGQTTPWSEQWIFVYINSSQSSHQFFFVHQRAVCISNNVNTAAASLHKFIAGSPSMSNQLSSMKAFNH